MHEINIGNKQGLLTLYSESQVVNRAYKAVTMIYQLTNRVPELIKQSHLERKEGLSNLILFLQIV